MMTIRQEFFEGERSLFGARELEIYDSIFDNGESPLKESANIKLFGSMFKWKYPLWYAKDIYVKDCTFFDMARAGIWYTKNIAIENCVAEAPKLLRRAEGVKLTNVDFVNAAETLWHCRDVDMKNVSARGDYFAMNCADMRIDGLRLVGNYSFDGGKNIEIRNSQLLSKDAFWNGENITVYDSFISGEYLGWNSKKLTLINCTIESLQGMCYIDDLVMRNCKLINTTLAFEYSTVDAEINSKIDSVINPSGGIIRAERIDELILEKDKIDPTKSKIIVA
ncbi:MAG: DUF3737 family protein [Clostridia bacterium]|nr:DUF3737 family protein [Clostridia bacterium]